VGAVRACQGKGGRAPEGRGRKKKKKKKKGESVIEVGMREASDRGEKATGDFGSENVGGGKTISLPKRNSFFGKRFQNRPEGKKTIKSRSGGWTRTQQPGKTLGGGRLQYNHAGNRGKRRRLTG